MALPGVDGIEPMRALPALAGLPVIFVSAYAGGDTIARAMEAGAAETVSSSPARRRSWRRGSGIASKKRNITRIHKKHILSFQ